ncbi:MAG: hypothetical protein GY793_08175 [Proteobacteria bacterium]|nr:hypothetical protein [Pseudomonadota bacterium]
MKTKERELANKIAAHWYDELHMQHAPIFQKQKLADFVETELKTLGLFSVVFSEERAEVCKGGYLKDGKCLQYDGNCTKDLCDYWQT